MNQRCAKERKYNDSNRRQHYFAFKLKENWGLNFCSEHLCVPKHNHITKWHHTKWCISLNTTITNHQPYAPMFILKTLTGSPFFLILHCLNLMRHPWSAQRNCRWKGWEARSDISRCQAGFGFMIRSVFLLDFGCFCVFVSPPATFDDLQCRPQLGSSVVALSSSARSSWWTGRKDRSSVLRWGYSQSVWAVYRYIKITDCLYRKERKGERLLCMRTLERVINLVIEQ